MKTFNNYDKDFRAVWNLELLTISELKQWNRFKCFSSYFLI